MASTDYYGTSGDCGVKEVGSTFLTGTTTLEIGDVISTGNNAHAWVPFTIDLPPGTTINSAIVKFVASTSLSNTTCRVKIGCEAAANPATPASYADFQSRTMTTNYLTTDLPTWSAGNTYQYTITTAVAEVIALGAWASGNTLAVYVRDNSSTNDASRVFATYEHATYSQPILTIDYTLPSGGSYVMWWD